MASREQGANSPASASSAGQRTVSAALGAARQCADEDGQFRLTEEQLKSLLGGVATEARPAPLEGPPSRAPTDLHHVDRTTAP
eukprot:3722654-Pyramimonas_sp.AAC.1